MPEPRHSTRGWSPGSGPLGPSPQWVNVSEWQVELALAQIPPEFRSLSVKPLFTSASHRRKCEAHSHSCQDHTGYASHFYQVLNQAKLNMVLFVDVYIGTETENKQKNDKHQLRRVVYSAGEGGEVTGILHHSSAPRPWKYLPKLDREHWVHIFLLGAKLHVEVSHSLFYRWHTAQ